MEKMNPLRGCLKQGKRYVESTVRVVCHLKKYGFDKICGKARCGYGYVNFMAHVKVEFEQS